MSSGLFKTVINKICLQIIYLIYMYKEDLTFNNLQWLICHKTKPNSTIVCARFLFNLNEILALMYLPFLRFLDSFETYEPQYGNGYCTWYCIVLILVPAISLAQIIFCNVVMSLHLKHCLTFTGRGSPSVLFIDPVVATATMTSSIFSSFMIALALSKQLVNSMHPS